MPFVDDQGNPVPVQPLAAPPPPVVPLTLADQQAMTQPPVAPPPPAGIDFASAAATAPLPDMAPEAQAAFNGPPVAPGAPAQPSQVAPVIPIRRAQGAAPAAVAPTDATFANLDQGIEENQQKQAAALAAQGETEAAGHEAVAAEKTKVAGIQWRQAAELAAQQQYVRDKQSDLNEIDRQNLDYARNKVIPDFWSGREGEHVGATIGALLAGFGAGFLGSTQNQAAEIIQHNTDKYFDRKKEEIDNLYKYATAQGLVNDKARDQYAKSLIDLSQQHAAVLDAAKARVEAVAEESQSPDAKARAAVLASQLTNAATKEHLDVQGLRDKHYEMSDQSAASRAKLMEARAAIIRAGAEANRVKNEGAKAKTGEDEKADEAAFRTYVQAPHGKEAQTLNLRLSNIDSGLEDIRKGKSEGEVTKALEAVISADTGQGTRGVSQGQLHTIIPNLVSAEGKISNAVSQNWNGKAGKEYREAVTRLAQSVKDNREREYQTNRANLEKNLALTPHGQKNANFAKTSAAQLYPDRPESTPAAAAKPQQMKVGNKIYNLQPDGNYL